MTEQLDCCEEFARMRGAATGGASLGTALGRSMSRRTVMRGGAVAGAAALVGTTTFGEAFVETAYAAGGVADQVLVVLSLRGAADGLSLVVPHGDPVYYQSRPRIAVPKASLLVPDSFFGLHPSLKPLLPLWSAQQMAVVHATGLPVPNRSHFSAMEEVEDANPGSATRRGWLNRLLGDVGSGTPLEGIQVHTDAPLTSLYGPAPTFSVDRVDAVQVAFADGADRWHGRIPSLQTLWAADPGAFGPALRTALGAAASFNPVKATSAVPANGAQYPSGDLASALRGVARTVRANVGAEVMCVDFGNWDMHTNLGTVNGGRMVQQASQVAQAIAAFFVDLGPLASKVTLVTLSEFGRRVVENADMGLNHGWGNVMMLFGAGVKGGYYGNWPGLQNTLDADVQVTTDYRSVLSEIVSTRFGASTAAVFPNFSPSKVGVMTSL